MKILKNIEKLAVDANPILSAIIGGSAREVFLKVDYITFYTTLFNFREVERYIPVLASKRNITSEELYMSLSTLPLSVCENEFYKETFQEAKRMIGKRDPDDVHLLALSLKLSCPIWSNDRDFKGCGVKIFTSLDLISKL